MNPKQPSLFRSRHLHTLRRQTDSRHPYSDNLPDVYTSVATLGRWVLKQLELSKITEQSTLQEIVFNHHVAWTKWSSIIA